MVISIKNNYKYLFIFLFYFFLYFFTKDIPVHPDEAYYWQWSKFLDFSYYDQGPGIAIYLYLLRHFLGDNLRLMGILSNAIAFFFFYLYAKYVLKKLNIKESLLGLFFIFISIPALWGISFMLFHDSLLLICWNASIYFFIKSYDYWKKHHLFNSNFYLLIIFIGIGTLTKYTMIHFILSIFVFLFIVLKLEEFFLLLKSHSFYIGIILYLILIFPILFWNINHNWIGIDAIKYLRSSGGGFKVFSLHKYLISFLLSLSPLYLVYLFLGFKKYKEFYKQEDSLIFLFINVLVVFLFFLLFSFFKEVQGNWILVIYPTISFFLYYFYKINLHKKFFLFSLIFAFFISITSLNVFKITYFLEKKFKISIPIYYFSSINTYGYKEISENLYQLLKNLQQEKKQEIDLLANSYQDASIVNYYLKNKIYFIPSLNILIQNQYDIWNGIRKNRFYLFYEILNNPCKITLHSYPEKYQFILQIYFEEVQYIDKIVFIDPLLGKETKIVYMYLVKNFKGNPEDKFIEYINNQMIYNYMPNLLTIEEIRKISNSKKGLEEDLSKLFTLIKEFKEIYEKNEKCTIL